MIASYLFATLVVASAAACGGQDPTSTVSPSSTFAPTLAASPTPTIPPFKTLTLQASLSPLILEAGDTLTVHTDSGGSGIPQFTLSVDDVSISIVRWDGSLVQESPSQAVEVVSWRAGPMSATWELRAIQPGGHSVNLWVSGEVGASPGGPFYFTSGTQRFQFTVNAAP